MCYLISPQFTITNLSEHVFHVRREDKDREKRFRSVILRSSLDSEGGKKFGKCYLSEAKSSLDVVIEDASIALKPRICAFANCFLFEQDKGHQGRKEAISNMGPQIVLLSREHSS